MGSMESFHKLSIQVGLNGLSFCTLDTVNNTLVSEGSKQFQIEQTPYLLLKELQTFVEEHKLIGKQFSEVIIIHRNKLFSLVPKSLFNSDNLRDYLKFNARVNESDIAAFEELSNFEIVTVYLTYAKINNYIFEVFGEYKSIHSATIFLETFLKQNVDLGTACFVNVLERQMELMVVNEKKLLLYNQYDFDTKEDFLYYLLFSFEQLGINTDDVALQLFGVIDEQDALFEICYEFVRNISIINPINSKLSGVNDSTSDFTVFNSL